MSSQNSYESHLVRPRNWLFTAEESKNNMLQIVNHVFSYGTVNEKTSYFMLLTQTELLQARLDQ